jgi:hypothetical protein
VRFVPIDRIPAPDAETFRREILPQEKPFILTGLTKGWNAENWSPEYLKSKIGDVTAQFKCGPDRVELPFREGIDKICNSSEPYQLYNDSLITEHYYALLEDLRLPAYIEADKMGFASFWISGARPFNSRLHFDGIGCHNLNVQIKGSKKVWLFHPSDGEHLYPEPVTQGEGSFCLVDIAHPDLERFPGVEKATCYEGVLNESDAIYHPATWYHSFHHTGQFNVNVNYWWYQLRYEINGNFRRWLFLESLTAFALDRQAKTGKAVSLADFPPEVIDFVSEVEQFLLRYNSQVVFSDPQLATWEALVAYRRQYPQSPFFERPLPEQYSLRF